MGRIYEISGRLEEIREEMHDLLGEAKSLLREVGGMTEQRARAYWIAHIETALDEENDYLCHSMCTMQSTIEELTDDDDFMDDLEESLEANEDPV